MNTHWANKAQAYHRSFASVCAGTIPTIIDLLQPGEDLVLVDRPLRRETEYLAASAVHLHRTGDGVPFEDAEAGDANGHRQAGLAFARGRQGGLDIPVPC